jgi:hypothetical protein
MTSAGTPDGGARTRHAGARRRRLFRHYLPLVMATAGAMAVLVSVPFFDVNRYPPPGDIFAEGAKGALPDGDYPPPGDSTATTAAPPTTAAADRNGRPDGDHAPATTAHSRRAVASNPFTAHRSHA